MSDNGFDESTKFILQDMKDDIKLLDKKWEKALERAASRDEILKNVSVTVEKLSEVLVSGNGRPSIVMQVSNLQRDVDDIAETQKGTSTDLHEINKDITALRIDLGISRTPKEVRKARLVFASKVVGLLATIAAEAAVIASLFLS